MQADGTNTGKPVIDPEAWVDRHGDYLYRYALLRVRDPKVAEDMVQETFLGAIASMKAFSGQSSEKTWLVGILKHKIVDHFRRSSREYSVPDSETELDAAEEAFDARGRWRVKPSEWTTDPGAALEQKEFLDVLRGCLSGLPPRLAHAFALRELNEMSSEEICNILGVSPTNLWVMLHRARLRLKQCLESKWLVDGKERKR